MIAPRKVRFEAKKKLNENLRFRSFLKSHAREEELDEQFLELHRELFADYDCSRCRNCCKLYQGLIPEADLDRDAEWLGMTRGQFMDIYLETEKEEECYRTKHKPCDFLQEDGECKLGDCKPENCRKYPYTHQPERLQSLYSVLDTVEVCPVAFEIYERLKVMYGFKAR